MLGNSTKKENGGHWHLITENQFLFKQKMKNLSNNIMKEYEDRPIRRVVTAKLHRNPSTELERLRRKGENWTANDLFRFQVVN